MANTGQRAWDPAAIHVSYHWLWGVPRELVSRSRWNIPYHNGIRTDLPHPIEPGTRITLDGRLLAPDWPGIYWLQWDLVEEGVSWFAQVSPRQRRTLAVVLPPLTWVVAPIPFVVALVGFIAVSRRRREMSRGVLGRMAPIADALWCGAALAAKPLIVVSDALLEPTATAYWLMIVVATAVPVLGLLILPRRLRAWTLVGVGILGSLFVLADVLYYRFFGDVLSMPAMLAVRQTGHVWGSIRSLLSPLLIWIVADWPLAIAIAVRLARSDAPAPSFGHRLGYAAAVAGIVGAAGFAVSAPQTLRALSLDQMFRDRAVVEQLGVYGFHGYDAWNYARSTVLRPSATEREIADAAAWFRERAARRAGTEPWFGAARGRNLIVVQVESLQDFVVDYRIEGQEVMPHLKRWTADSLRFTAVTDETSEGRTSDAEFSTLTSLLPLDHGAVAFRYPGNHYIALPRVLAERGYDTVSAVPFEPGFWNRQVMHPSYGFKQSLFEPDFQLTEQIGWGLNDRDFLQQMLPHLESLPTPFAAWMITLSLHHPFADFPAQHKTLKLGALEGTSFGNYLHTMRFFDDALESFKTALARDGLLNTSVVVVFGDHDAGFVQDAALARTMGIGQDAASWTLNDRIPLFIRVPDAGSPSEDAGVTGLRGARSTPAGQTDFAPTLLALLGIDPAGFPYLGRNLLGAPSGPVARPYGEWIDDQHVFMTRSAVPACWDLAGRSAPRAACAPANLEIRRTREISQLVVTADLQEKLRVQ